MLHSPPQSPPPFRVAETLVEVLAAWRLVHDAYVAKGIIDPNPFGLHSNVHATRPGTLVVYGESTRELSSTLTIMRDSEAGLPLDEVCRRELDALRRSGERLCELGLFTHRSSELPVRFIAPSLALALPDDLSRIVIGVHPRHVGFYVRMFGFTRASDERQYPALKRAPVCLLQLNRRAFIRAEQPRWGERFTSLAALLSPERAYDFEPIGLARTVLGQYLASRSGATPKDGTPSIKIAPNTPHLAKEQAPP